MADDYTPTTADVRFHWQRNLIPGDPGRQAQFDRWLAQHDQDVAAKAWDEGYKRSERDDQEVVYTTNPYCTEETP